MFVFNSFCFLFLSIEKKEREILHAKKAASICIDCTKCKWKHLNRIVGKWHASDIGKDHFTLAEFGRKEGRKEGRRILHSISKETFKEEEKIGEVLTTTLEKVNPNVMVKRITLSPRMRESGEASQK